MLMLPCMLRLTGTFFCYFRLVVVLGRDEFTRYRCVRRSVVALLRRIRLPVHLPVRLSANSSVRQLVCLPVRLSVSPSVCWFLHPLARSVCRSVCPSARLVPPSTGPVHLPVRLSASSSVCRSVCPPARLSAGSSIHWPGPSVRQPVWFLHPLARSICPPARLSAGPSVRQPVCLLVPPSTGPVRLPVRLFAGSSIHWPVCLPVRMPAGQSVCRTVCPLVRLSVYPLVHLSTGSSIC